MIYFYLLGLAALARISFWTESFGVSVDESNYMAIAEAWDHYGTIYLDAVDRKPPLLYAVYWLLGKGFGFFHLHAIHLVALLGTWGLAILADRWGRNIDPKIPKGLTGVLVILTSSSLSREVLAFNSELVMMLFLMPGFYLLSQLDLNSRLIAQSGKIFLAGLLLGLACLVKQIAVLPIGMVAVFLWAWGWKGNIFLPSIKRTLILFAGFLSSFLFLFLILHFAGNWQGFWDWVIFENLGYIRDAEKAVGHDSHPLSFLVPILVTLIWLGLWIGSYRSVKKQFPNPYFLIALGAAMGSLLTVYLGSRLFSHYFVPLLFFFPVVASAGIYELFKTKFKNPIVALVVLPFIFFALFNSARDFWIRLGSDTKKIHSFDLATQAKLKEISTVIIKSSTAEDRMSIWGMAGQIFLMSERGSGTRFIYTDYVSGRLAGFSSNKSHPHPKAMEFFLTDLENKKPQIFVDLSGSKINDYQFFPLENFPALRDYLQAHYQKADAVLGAQIWKRRTDVP